MTDEQPVSGPTNCAMQTCCPHCLTEQHALDVPGFSAGDFPCSRCEMRSKPMTIQQWIDAMDATRLRQAARKGQAL